MKRYIISLLVVGGMFALVQADCIYKVEEKSTFSILDSNTLVLQNNNKDNSIVIELDCTVKESSLVVILEDSFCDYYDNVFSVDNKLCSVDSVVKLN